MAIGADILIVAATLVLGVSIASVVARWSERRWSVPGLVGLAVAAGLFVHVHLRTEGGLTWTDVPDSFILVAARVLN
ncbi:hypothetical protein P6F26_11015 [Roseibacterium sp. SDUM158017]|uniref:hypothetical protein n=1 Tax=Roseicyclus salinarum TaxID=3036773 RepID=UPI002414E1D2|nr:hypothetical protein [Roseibacterium sp. SDUM158017]MDG4648974.1 hypothetical protein [Roseibacterium sp. SDUM158017]